MYTCGVTVYDESHIGHARSLYIFDVIRRYLKYRGFKVKFVRNITDIDDKIIERSRQLKIDWAKLVEKYIKLYYEDLRRLGIEKGDFEPRATENIQEILRFIQGLIDKGYAYVTDTGVYFNVRKFKGYGRLSGQSIDDMLKGSRKEPDETKHDPLDFALWKRSKPDEPFWESPWGKGRPGWHIECSVMSTKYLKTDTLDIHAGGRDLIFPHHENEIAQAEALSGKPFARYWLHHGLLTINGQKMAKSLGNFVTIKDFIDKYKDADILKLFFLSTHYSHPIDYNETRITEAREALDRINILMGKIKKLKGKKSSRMSLKDLEDIRNRFIQAMDDDFNMPEGLARIFDLVSLANKNIDDTVFAIKAGNLLLELTGIFGLDIKKKIGQCNLPSRVTVFQIEELIEKRNKAREIGAFKEADRIRKELEEKGIILEDTKEGTTWRSKL